MRIFAPPWEYVIPCRVFDGLQCIDEALQKCFILPRTVIGLFPLRLTDVPDENARVGESIIQPSAENY